MGGRKKVVIAGATGLVGSHCMIMLLQDESIAEVTILVRKTIDYRHERLRQTVVDYNHLEPTAVPDHTDALFCCLGTTMRNAGSRENFKRVDYDYVLKLATLCERNKVRQFHVISAMGANPKSGIFYNKVKGQMEKFLGGLNIPAIHIYRPSLLLGERDENRPGERVGIFFAKTFGFLIPKKYKAIRAEAVAAAMIRIFREGQEGQHVHESVELRELSGA